MDEKERNQIALFRYGVIAPLVTAGETTPAERGNFFREASDKTYENTDGAYVKISADTIYRWYRNYRNNGFDGLKPNARSDLGKARKLDDDIISQINYLHKEYPRLPATMIYEKLLASFVKTLAAVQASGESSQAEVSKLEDLRKKIKVIS